MVTSCDRIDPYTASGLFGNSYNGGYKPDTTIKWIPPDTNVVDDSDDFVPPPSMPPSNMLMQTCEGRRIDPRIGGVPERVIEYDDPLKEIPQLQQVPSLTVSTNGPLVSEKVNSTNILLLSIVLILVFLFVTKFR
jgi:hypothetical protein